MNEFVTSLQSGDWQSWATAGLATLVALWGLVKVWVKVTPSKTDDAAIENASKYIDPILKGAEGLVRPQDKQLAQPRKSTIHGTRVVRGEKPSDESPSGS